MNGNMEIASGKLAEFIGKGDLSKGMVRIKRKKYNVSNQIFEQDFKAVNQNYKNKL